MSPKKLIIALWAVVALVALAIVLAPSGDGYREFAATQVTSSSPTKVAASPEATAPAAASPSAPSTASSPSAPAAVSLSRVASLLEAAGPAPTSPSTSRNVSAPGEMSPVATKPEADSLKGKTAVGLPSSWRPAPSVSPVEVEAYVRQERMDEEQAVVFRTACAHDHSLRFDQNGQALYACPSMVRLGPDTSRVTSVPTYPLAETFRLHSRPTSRLKIFLDFDGHVTSRTRWNTTWRGGADFTTPAFSIDASPAFNDEEKAIVQESFRRIAEHFAPWNVDVTTEDPGVDRLRKTNTSDAEWGIRVVIGPDVNATGAGGIAFLNSFDDSADTPCYTFTNAFSDAAYVAGVSSHEIGHTVTLVHQGQTPGTGAYFSGHGTGALSWSPIMGNGLRPVNQWAKGEYLNSTSKQDNFTAITSKVPLMFDDHGNTIHSASVATGVALSAGGVIGSAADVDVFRFTAGRGNLVITPKVSMFAPNLRLQIRVLGATGNILATIVGSGAAGNMAPGPITFALPAEGTYYIQLDGIGNGTGVTEGYTDYGSLGYYSFEAEWPQTGNRPPVANATLSTNTAYDFEAQPTAAVNLNGVASTDLDGTVVRHVWDFKDVGPAGAVGALATYRYKAPGTYFPTLTVFDNQGASASTTVTVTVTGTPRARTCSLGQFAGSFVRVNSVHDAANASILVQDQYGNPVSSALVHVAVSGLVRSPKIVVRTNALGQANVASPNFRRGARGSLVFTVSKVEAPGFPYVLTTPAPVVTVPSSLTLTR